MGEGDEGVNKAVLKIKSEEIQIVFSFTNDYIYSSFLLAFLFP